MCWRRALIFSCVLLRASPTASTLSHFPFCRSGWGRGEERHCTHPRFCPSLRVISLKLRSTVPGSRVPWKRAISSSHSKHMKCFNKVLSYLFAARAFRGCWCLRHHAAQLMAAHDSPHLFSLQGRTPPSDEEHDGDAEHEIINVDADEQPISGSCLST